MKKKLSVLIAMIIVMSVFLLPANAMEVDEGTVYTVICPACGQRLSSKVYTYTEQYAVPGCADFDDYHVHYDRYSERDWFCGTADCELVGYVISRNTTKTASNLCHLLTPIS